MNTTSWSGSNFIAQTGVVNNAPEPPALPGNNIGRQRMLAATYSQQWDPKHPGAGLAEPTTASTYVNPAGCTASVPTLTRQDDLASTLDMRHPLPTSKEEAFWSNPPQLSNPSLESVYSTGCAGKRSENISEHWTRSFDRSLRGQNASPKPDPQSNLQQGTNPSRNVGILDQHYVSLGSLASQLNKIPATLENGGWNPRVVPTVVAPPITGLATSVVGIDPVATAYNLKGMSPAGAASARVANAYAALNPSKASPMIQTVVTARAPSQRR